MVCINNRYNSLKKAFAIFVTAVFLLVQIVWPANSQAQTALNLPIPGSMVQASSCFSPAILRGLIFHQDDPLRLDFIVDTGDNDLQGEVFKNEAEKLIEYFLASLTVPENEFWVNLSPYEADRIIPNPLSITEMGRALLSQDYILKQLTASLMYPEERLGEEFWKRVYKRAQEELGTTSIPFNTFNKIWIVPDKAVVYQYNHRVFIGERHLKVMLEEDYLALKKNSENTEIDTDQLKRDNFEVFRNVSSEIVRQVIVPEIEKEVNEGENFSTLRQVFNSMILATWYKKSLREGLLGQIYIDKNKVKGIDIEDKEVKQKIYGQYLEAFEQGVFSYIKKDYDESTRKVIPRKYFSGGVATGIDANRDGVINYDESLEGRLEIRDFAYLSKSEQEEVVTPESKGQNKKVSVVLNGSSPLGDDAVEASIHSGFFGIGREGVFRRISNKDPPEVPSGDFLLESDYAQGVLDISQFNGFAVKVKKLPDSEDINEYVDIQILGDFKKFQNGVHLEEIKAFLVEVGQNSKNIIMLEKIVKILGVLDESYVDPEQKLDVLQEILERSPANPAYHGIPNLTHVYQHVKEFAYEVKRYKDKNPEIDRPKIAFMGIYDGKMAYLEWLNAQALGVDLDVYGVDYNLEKLNEAAERFRGKDFKKIHENLFNLDPLAPKWGGEETFDIINLEAVMHEIFSYGGSGGEGNFDSEKGAKEVELLMKKLNRMLVPDGQLLLIDGVLPEKAEKDEVVRLSLDSKSQEAFTVILKENILPLSRGCDIDSYRVEGDSENTFEMTKNDLTYFLTKIKYVIQDGGTILGKNVGSYYSMNDELEQVFAYASKGDLFNMLSRQGFTPVVIDDFTPAKNLIFYNKHITIETDYPAVYFRIVSIKRAKEQSVAKFVSRHDYMFAEPHDERKRFGWENQSAEREYALKSLTNWSGLFSGGSLQYAGRVDYVTLEKGRAGVGLPEAIKDSAGEIINYKYFHVFDVSFDNQELSTLMGFIAFESERFKHQKNKWDLMSPLEKMQLAKSDNWYNLSPNQWDGPPRMILIPVEEVESLNGSSDERGFHFADNIFVVKQGATHRRDVEWDNEKNECVRIGMASLARISLTIEGKEYLLLQLSRRSLEHDGMTLYKPFGGHAYFSKKFLELSHKYLSFIPEIPDRPEEMSFYLKEKDLPTLEKLYNDEHNFGEAGLFMPPLEVMLRELEEELTSYGLDGEISYDGIPLFNSGFFFKHIKQELDSKEGKRHLDTGIESLAGIIGDKLPLDNDVLKNSENTVHTDAKDGGIDFNELKLDLQIKRDNHDVSLPVYEQPIESLNIEGFIPIIINVTPVTIPMLLGSENDS